MNYELKCSGCEKAFTIPIDKLPIKSKSATCRACKTKIIVPARNEVEAKRRQLTSLQEVTDSAKPNSNLSNSAVTPKNIASMFQIGIGAIALIWGIVVLASFTVDYFDDTIRHPPQELLNATLIARPGIDDFGGIDLNHFLAQFYSKVWPTGLQAKNSSWRQSENVYILEFTVRKDGVREEFIFEYLRNPGAADVVLFRHPTAQNWFENIDIATNILMGNKTAFDIKKEYYERAERRSLEQSGSR